MLKRLQSIPLRVRYRLAPLLDKCPESLLPERHRAIQVFGVGMPRSGTVSLNDVFKHRYRAAHEPESRFLTNQIVAYHEGRVSREQLLGCLRRRDRRLGLELDSSYLNGEIAAELAEAFPQARFVLTLRDCVSWVESMTSFFMNKPEFMSAAQKPHVLAHMALQFGVPPYTYAAEESVLQAHGLHPLSAYLKYWHAHNSLVIESLPAERLLVVRTRELGQCAARLERFLDLPQGSLQQATHSNAAPARHSLVAQIDQDYLRQQVHLHCGALMQQFFPEVLETL